MKLSEDDICYLLNWIGQMIDGDEEEDLMSIWNYLTYMLSREEE